MFEKPMRVRQLRAILLILPMLASFVLASSSASEKKLTRGELKTLIATAETKSDHERIAKYFDAEAATYEAEAKEHSELATGYGKNPPSQPTKFPGSMQTYNHCNAISKSLSQAADDARAIAAEHRKMAEQATK